MVICLDWLLSDLLDWFEIAGDELAIELHVPPSPIVLFSELNLVSWEAELNDGTLNDNTFGKVAELEIGWFIFCFESLFAFFAFEELEIGCRSLEEDNSNPVPRFCLFSATEKK